MKKKWIGSGLVLLIMILLTGCQPAEDKRKEEQEEVDLFKEIEEEDKEASANGGVSFPNFQCEDQFGNEVTDDIFKDYALTLVNVWGTWCPPCVGELPDLADVHRELLEEGINVIGIVQDGRDNTETMEQLLEEAEVEYTNLIPSKDLEKEFVSGIKSYPTSFLVDSEGKIVGREIVGARDAEAYKSLLKKELSGL